jgi:hypothetical protein
MREYATMMRQNKNNFPRENSNRIVLFADLRNSTDILLNFEKRVYYKKREGQSEDSFDYGEFILDVHEMSYRELYLGHENTYAEIYGDGFMGVFPEDNTAYILENIYRFSNKMRLYNDSLGVGVSRPKIDMGFGVTVGEVTFVYYPLDERHHPVGYCMHEAARIQGVSKLYDARVLVSHRFLNFAKVMISSDSRFSYRFIDRVILKDFREPSILYEILLDNDPRFEIKKKSIQTYSEAYSKYCEKEWKEAKEIFYTIYQEYGLGIGDAMAKRCDILAASPPTANWDGTWKLKNK